MGLKEQTHGVFACSRDNYIKKDFALLKQLLIKAENDQWSGYSWLEV